MNRKQFMESLGATCDNWQWSWSFVNNEEKFVIFGAWDIHQETSRCKILEPSWQIKKDGNKNPGFKQALRHIKLCEDEGYLLKTFKMFYEEGNPETGTAKIKDFDAVVVDKILVKEDGAWFAYASAVSPALSEEIGSTDEVFLEGNRSPTSGTKVERNRQARKACLEKFGYDCSVCEFNFEDTFGRLGEGFIHVHHLNPVAATDGEYLISPETDLRPVCPNCHAMLHRKPGPEPLSISELQKIIAKGTAK